ncbi:protein STICHEL-like 4 [Lolium rigidum]|uniref:protein STICHEL-like 4 n=1 Tax=Lolium rigidum TaxID=89674 RepID=UPI001F5D6852|nr:protein STICHEL-like 4 [Lolium rigidum]
MPGPPVPPENAPPDAPAAAGGSSGEHLRGHAHLTNCIHLRHHHAHAGAASGRRRSPTTGDSSATLMRDLLSMQRSRSLRDPSTRRSVDSASNRLAADPGDPPGRGALKTLLDQLAEDALQPRPARRPRRRFKRGQGRRAAADAALDRPAAAAFSANSSSQEAVCGNKYFFGAGGGGDDDGSEEMQQRPRPHPQASQDSRSVCGIPWNWSRLHNRSRSILDTAGRSLSCGLSDPRAPPAARRSEAATSAGSCGGGGYMNGSRSHPHFPVTARLTSSNSSDSDSLPLLGEGARSRTGIRGISRSFSGELGIFSNQSSEFDSDLMSEARSGQKSQRGRHRSLTQKYAPRTFKDVVGQSLVVQALSNAILKRKIGSVYVFYGPHGTGKTSCARVFAKALNCHSAEHPRPCDTCASCIAHNLGKSRSLVEIGPVGNIDLDSIVDILDNVMLSPLPAHHRVFIVDDCNTLPPDTWSVISKVVERAPRRVVFILISPNLELPHIIMSRCQKFFFPKLKECDIVNTLQWICTSDGLDVDRDALKLIASRSDGSLRDAQMTLDQLSLLGQRISISLVQELVGLVSDDKLVNLLDLALSADTANTVKTLRDITETGVEPLSLMSQLATIITDILAGAYTFTQGGVRRKFFKRPTLSKEDMEKLRQALKTLSEAEKQLRVSNDKMTWLTAALLQLAPDKQYTLPSSSTSTSFNQGLPNCHEGYIARNSTTDNNEIYAGPLGYNGGRRAREHTPDGYKLSTSATRVNEGSKCSRPDNEMIWQAVLEIVQSDSLRRMMAQEGRIISVSLGTAPTVQLMFSSHVNKSKAEKSRGQIMQAFESVLSSAIILEIRYESEEDGGGVPAILPYHEDTSSNIALRRSFTKHSSVSSGGEIIEVGPSQMEWYDEPDTGLVATDKRRQSVREAAALSSQDQENIGPRGGMNVNNEHDRQRNIVRGKVSLAHVINRAEGCSQHGGWPRQKAMSITEKLEQENLRLEPRSSLLCWKASSTTRRKLSALKIRTRRSQALSRLVLCGRCISVKSPR